MALASSSRPGQSPNEAVLTAAVARQLAAQGVYNNNPTPENKANLDIANAGVFKAQAAVGGTLSRSVTQKSVSSTGEGATAEVKPITNQTEEPEEGEDSEAEPEPDNTPFIYSDVNMHYILDKRHCPIRTLDNLLHVFFLESYKSIQAWYDELAGDADGEEIPDEPPPDGTRYAGIEIKVLRKAGGEAANEEISYTVSPPKEFNDVDEDNIVDSVLWVYTSYKEGVTAMTHKNEEEPEEGEEAPVDDQVLPILSAGDSEGGFMFPVFIVDPEEDVLRPLTNIKYFSMFFNPHINYIDMTFWSNYRVTEDATATSHPFTRQRDLRNVGRTLMFTTGWYDKAKIIFEDRTYYRNIFVFSPPKQVFTPGLGGEFDVERIEPVVDSVPMGLKFVEFST